MELKEFIKCTLIDIIDAVEDARNEIGNDRGKSICPSLPPAMRSEAGIKMDLHGDFYQNVEFDVAVTAGTEGKGGGKAGIRVFGLEAGIDSKLSSTNSSISKIKFHVPIMLSRYRTTEKKNAEQT